MASIAANAVSGAAAFALLSGLMLNVPATTAQSSSSVSGEAYGVAIQTPTASLAPSPLATLDAVSGMTDAEAASVSAVGILAAESLVSMTTGVIGENAASAQSSATLQNLNILNGLITAKAVRALASSASNGSTATSDAAGSGFVGLVVNGIAIADGAPAPNTQLALPGVGTVVLNEQLQRGDGQTTSALTVRMIHVRLTDSLTGATRGEIITGAAQSDAAFVR